MVKFRKKPILVQAIQFENTAECLCAISKFMNREMRVDYQRGEAPVIEINTLEGTMYAKAGDFIIKGVKGEFYPCKPDVFEATYERVG